MPPLYTDEIETLAFTTFTFMLDTIRTNSKTIPEDNKKIVNNFEFTYQLGKALVLPKIRKRLENSNGMQIAVLQKVRRVLGLPEVNCRPFLDLEAAVTPIGCCHMCAESIVGTKTSWKTEQQIESKSVVFVRVSFIKSTNTSSNSIVKIVLSSDILAFSMSMWKMYDVYLSF